MAKKTHTRTVTPWYPEYWAQTWYKNTFLVRRPEQIAREIGGERGWNNLYHSGCNFACIAMIIGIDPARLASELSAQPFFAADKSAPARYVSGKRGRMVWDQNAPHETLKVVTLRRVWHSKLGHRTTIRIRYDGEHIALDHAAALRIVARAHRQGRHLICGPETHAHLVAGRVGRDFYVWDPDDTEHSVEDNLRRKVTLRRMFTAYPDQPIEFCQYRVNFT
jgi:hypothetical protein